MPKKLKIVDRIVDWSFDIKKDNQISKFVLFIAAFSLMGVFFLKREEFGFATTPFELMVWAFIIIYFIKLIIFDLNFDGFFRVGWVISMIGGIIGLLTENIDYLAKGIIISIWFVVLCFILMVISKWLVFLKWLKYPKNKQTK